MCFFFTGSLAWSSFFWGRALAGVNGNTQARIFCQGLNAELVSIAGTYRVSEDIEDSVRSLPVQVYLDGKRLRIYPL